MLSPATHSKVQSKESQPRNLRLSLFPTVSLVDAVSPNAIRKMICNESVMNSYLVKKLISHVQDYV